MQFIFGFIVIQTSWGLTAMEFLADIFTTLLGYTIAGSSFVFAWLTDGSLFGRPFQLAPDEEGNDMGVYFLGPPFFFNVLPTVIFFSALMSVGYYIRALPWLVKKVGKLLNIDQKIQISSWMLYFSHPLISQDTFWEFFSVLRLPSPCPPPEIFLSVRPKLLCWFA